MSDPIASPEPQPSAQGERLIDLPSGEFIKLSEANVVMGAVATSVVIFGGPQESGKTTFISSLYERFRKGPFAGLSFAASNTLRGFERICHLGREASGLSVPQMPHTTLQMGTQMFHLCLRSQATGSPHDVLLTDLSGEEFENLRNLSETSKGLGYFARADRFVLFIDGAKIVELSRRLVAKDESFTILQRLLETGLVKSHSLVDVVISKWDLVEDGQQAATAKEFSRRLEEEITLRFASAVKEMRFGRVTGRHPRGRLPPAAGSEDLLPGWLAYAYPQGARYAGNSVDLMNAREIDRPAATLMQKVERDLQ